MYWRREKICFTLLTNSAILTITIFLAGCGRESVTAINYLDQSPPGMTAKIFAPGIISNDSFQHSAPAFSPDGKQVLWTIIPTTMGQPSFTLEMTYENGKWSAPHRPSFNNPMLDEVYPSFSIDGSRLYFSSGRKLHAADKSGNGNHIWQVKRNKEGWGTVTPVDSLLSAGHDYGYSITNNGTFYISGGRQGSGDWNIKRADPNGRSWLPYGINGTGYEDGPFIAPDESYLIFESQRPESVNGGIDLYITFRMNNSGWSLPVNLGPTINTSFTERFARVSPDGKYLFFGSNRNQSATNRGFDLYWIDAAVIDELKKSNPPVIDEILGRKIIDALDQAQWQEAAGLFNQWMAAYPDHLSGIIENCRVLRRLQKYQEAENFLVVKKTQTAGNIAATVELALVKYGTGKEEEATMLLAPAFENNDQLRELYNYLSSALFDMKKYKESDNYFSKAMEISPNSFQYYNRACAYALLDNKESAFEYLNKAIENGFNEKQHYETDKDLQSLKGDKRWTVLVAKLK